MNLRIGLRRTLRSFGFDLHRLPSGSLTLRDIEFDLPHLVNTASPVILDIGANRGQTIDMMRRAFVGPTIIAFEPNPDLFPELQRRYGSLATIENTAVGSAVAQLDFHVSKNSELSSLLNASAAVENPFSATPVQKTISVPVTTVDCYLAHKNINHIDILKSDTQGFDLEVLRGASATLSRGAVDTVLIEVLFFSLYQDQGTFGDIEQFLKQKGYGLIALYEIVRSRGAISWATACFHRIQNPQ
jgi:FkbM family methyltransferase